METRTFKPDLKSIHQIQAFVKEAISHCNRNPNKMMKIDLVIEEIAANIIKHGLKNIENGMIRISVEIAPDFIILEILDNGMPFNPLQSKTPDITAAIEDRTPGGLGIYIVKQIAEKIEYLRDNNENLLRLHIDL